MALTVYSDNAIEYCLNKVAHRKDELDLVILPGLMRTGTTVLFQSIRGTQGFRETHTARLLGTPPSEHQSFRIVNYLTSKFLGADCVLPGSWHDIRHGDLLFDRQFTIEEKPLDEFHLTLMDEAMKVFAYQELRVLKEPMGQFALEAWIDRYESFKRAKYIWTRRDTLDVAKSVIRLKVPDRDGKPRGYRGKLTVCKALYIAEQLEAELERVMPMVNHIEVQHSELVENPDKVFGEIAEFLGVEEINRKFYDRKQVYGKS